MKDILAQELLIQTPMNRVLFTVLFLFFVSELSLAEVYKWVDDKGAVHFTDDIIQVPEKYRPKAESMGSSEDKEVTKVGAESSQKKDEPYRDRLGRGEDYWKGRVEEWRKKLNEAQTKLEALRVRYNDLTQRFNDSKNTVERSSIRKERDQVKSEMDQSKIQIEETNEMLEKKIPEEADLYKARPEWVKQ